MRVDSLNVIRFCVSPSGVMAVMFVQTDKPASDLVACIRNTQYVNANSSYRADCVVLSNEL